MLQVSHRGFDFLEPGFQRNRIRLRHDVQLSILIVADKEMPNSAACQGKSVTGADLTDDRRRCRFQFFTITGSGFPEHTERSILFFGPQAFADYQQDKIENESSSGH